MSKVTTSFNNWDFNSQHVQQNLTGGDFVGSHTVIVCATAPRISDLSTGGGTGTSGTSPDIGGGFTRSASSDQGKGTYAIPLGVVSDFTVNQNRQLQQIFELGSKRSYFLSARNITTIGLSRVFFHGPSLLRMMYAYYPDSKIGGGQAGNSLRDVTSCPDTKMAPIAYQNGDCQELPNISKKDLPGYDNFFINLASSLFSQPIGLVMYIKDNAGKDVGAVFFEECNIEAHQMGMSQGAVVIGEGLQIRCDRIVPIRVQVNRGLTEVSSATDTAPNSNTNWWGTLADAGGAIKDALAPITNVVNTVRNV